MKNNDFFNSIKWKNWVAHITETTCWDCKRLNGTIYNIDENVIPYPPILTNCRCEILPLKSIKAGKATRIGKEGADYFLKIHGRLPEYYISKREAALLGWEAYKKNLNEVAPGKMIFGGLFRNRSKKLPDRKGRIWYEADINYNGGQSNQQRLLFSNDGVMFITLNHYETFIEITE